MSIKKCDKCSWCGKEIHVTEEGNNLCDECAQFPDRTDIIGGTNDEIHSVISE